MQASRVTAEQRLSDLSGNATALPALHAGIRDHPQKADQIEIGGSKGDFGHQEEAIPPSSADGGSQAKGASETI